MQTLISAFDDRANARRAVDRLVQSGFSRADVHLHADGQAPQVSDFEGVRRLGDQPLGTAEREIALDRGVLESLGHFFVSLFGEDRGEKAAGTYGGAVKRGHSVLTVHASNDQEAESAAVILHECGATEVNDHHAGDGGTDTRPGVRLYERETSSS